MKKMSRGTKFLLLGGFIAILVTVGSIGVAVYLLSNVSLSRTVAKESIPTVIREPRTMTGDGLFEKTEILKDSDENFGGLVVGSFKDSVQDAKAIKSRSKIDKSIFGYQDAAFFPSTNEIFLMGRFGIQVMDPSGVLKRQFYLEPEVIVTNMYLWENKEFQVPYNNFKIVDLENDGKPEFIGYNGDGGIALFDAEGKRIFSRYKQSKDVSILWDKEAFEKEREKNPTIRGAAAGDLDGDGVDEIIFTTQNNEIVAVDRSGREMWRRKSESPGDMLWTFDLDGDSKDEILELSYAHPDLRSSDGNIIKSLDIDYDTNEDVFLTGDDADKRFHFIGINDGKIKITDENKDVLFEGEAPLSSFEMDQSNAAPVETPTPIDLGNGIRMESSEITAMQSSPYAYDQRFAFANLKKDSDKYITASASYWEYDRGVFYVYAPDGKLVYHELLGEEIEKIVPVPNANGTDDLFVIGKRSVWKYSPRF